MFQFRCPNCECNLLTSKRAGAQVECGWCRSLIRVRERSPFTEEDWLTSEDEYLLLQYARRQVSDRKLWLFCYACCRRVLERLGQAVDLAERHPDDPASRRKASQASYHADDLRRFVNGTHQEEVIMERLTAESIAGALWGPSYRSIDTDETAAQRDLLRDVVGNPFRPVTIPAAVLAWDDGTIPKLAQAIFEGRTFGEAAVLADALEEAGCGDEAILSHLRGAGPHVRGCWAIDLILGRE